MSRKLFPIAACALSTLCSLSIAEIPPNLAGYWKHNETNEHATKTLDETGTSNGITHGEVKFKVSGMNSSSKAAKFEGSGKYIEIPHHDDFLLDEGTIVFWVWPEKFEGRYGLLSKDSTNYDTGGHLSVFLESDKRVSVRLQSTKASYTIKSKSTLEKEEWSHIAITFGPGGLELYLNGKLQDTNAYEGGLGTTSGGKGNYEPIVLGANSWQSNDLKATPTKDYFQGRLDDVGILNEKWDSSSIESLVAQTGPGTKQDLGDVATTPVFYVRTRGSDSNNGLSPKAAFRTIQSAINNSTRAGTIVYIGPGTYKESLYIGTGIGKAAVSGTEANPIRLVADLTGEFTYDSPGEVIIDGRSSAAYGITLASLDHWNFEGFSIRNQKNYGIYATNAGMSVLDCTFLIPASYGIYATATGDITVADCVFERSTKSGHMMWITPSNRKTPTSVTVTRNDATLKDDLYMSTGLEDGFSAIQRRSYTNRYTYGIIVYGYGNPLVDRVEVSNNQVSDFYLPIYSSVYSPSQTESIIANNTVTGSLYSIYSYAYNSGSTTIINNIIDTAYYGLMSYSYRGKAPIISGLMENSITYDMSRYRRAFEGNIIQGSPMFADAPAGDFSLMPGSPAIDAGTLAKAPLVDIAGRKRPADGDADGLAQIDLGAYELVNAPTRVKVVEWREIGVDGHR